MKLLIAIFIFGSLKAYSEDWICKEASSVRNGQTVLSCGIGRGKDLDKARKISRDNAVEEFEKLCELSSDCKDYDYNALPKRSDCSLQNGTYICYRAIAFEILPTKKSERVIDLSEIKKKLGIKRKEVLALEEKINKINELKNLEQIEESLQATEAELLNKESEQIKLELISDPHKDINQSYKYSHEVFKNSIKVGYRFQTAKIIESSETYLGFLLSYEYRIAKKLGFEVFVSGGSGFKSGNIHNSQDIPQLDNPNQIKTIPESSKYTYYGLGLTYYTELSGTYLKAQGGVLSARKTYYDVQYNGVGFQSSVTTNEVTANGAMTGLFIGFDSVANSKGFGWVVELGVESYSKTSSTGLAGGIAINFGF